jgi:hypothetical protein
MAGLFFTKAVATISQPDFLLFATETILRAWGFGLRTTHYNLEVVTLTFIAMKEANRRSSLTRLVRIRSMVSLIFLANATTILRSSVPALIAPTQLAEASPTFRSSVSTAVTLSAARFAVTGQICTRSGATVILLLVNKAKEPLTLPMELFVTAVWERSLTLFQVERHASPLPKVARLAISTNFTSVLGNS